MIATPFLAAGILLAWIGESIATTLTACLLAGLGGAAVWERVWLRGNRAAKSIEFHGDGLGRAILRNGENRAIRRNDAFVSRLLIVLPLDAPAGGSILVTPDMLLPEEHRILRVWTLWGGVAGATREPPAGQGN